MSIISATDLDRRIELLETKLIGQHLDDIIRKLQKLSQHFDDAKDSEKTPFRNVLNVSTEPGSSWEVVKNYILYQVGRRGSSEIWKYQRGAFSKDLVKDLDHLKSDASTIVNEIKSTLLDLCQKNADCAKTEEEKADHAKTKEVIESYFSDPVTKKLEKATHFKLVQLYLGYLARKHTAWLGENKPEKK